MDGPTNDDGEVSSRRRTGTSFSRRRIWTEPLNALALAEAEIRAARGPAGLFDLTLTNPTDASLPFDDQALTQALAEGARASCIYAPDPRGLPEARAALLADLARRDVIVDEDRVLFTTSTSEAYGFLFKLLGDPGDVVLVPAPSYPLFEHLATLEGLTPAPYFFWHDGDGWHLDEPSVDEACQQARREGRRVASIIAVSPNNPTGHWLTARERTVLESASARERAALIVDEVFQDYPLDGVERPPAERCAAHGGRDVPVLTFSLGGLSKSLGLPQVKLAWILVGGPTDDVRAAVRALELVADTYLSVTTAAQAALPSLLDLGDARRAVISARLLAHRREAEAVLAGSALSPLAIDGGWSLPLRVPSVPERDLGTDEQWVLAALRQGHTLAQPGFFFDMPTGGPHLILGLLSRPAEWRAGLAALRDLAATTL